MLQRQRHREILARLNAAGGVRVAELAKSLGVTEETIRRDLEKLGRAGRLIRTHGGAVPVVGMSHDLPFHVRSTAYHEEKQRIARRALQHVSEGDVIALDASSTVYELARIMPDIPLTVVTNALPVTAALMMRSQLRVLSTGGMLDTPTRSWVGSFAERALERVNIHKLFLSSKGIDPERGLSEIHDAQARVKRWMMDRAQKTVLLIDHSKLGARSVVSVAAATEVDVVITDASAAPEFLEGLRGMDIEVEVAE